MTGAAYLALGVTLAILAFLAWSIAAIPWQAGAFLIGIWLAGAFNR